MLKNIIKTTFILAILLLLTSCLDLDPLPPGQKEVTITFETGDSNTNIPAINGLPGSLLELPSDLFKEGFVFKYWELEGVKFEETTFPNSSITLKAVWEEGYAIYFEPGDYHDEVLPIYFGENDLIDGLPILSYKIDNEENGYTFLYWELDGKEFDFDTMPNNNLILTAKWQKINLIAFDVGSSNDKIEPLIVEVGEKLIAPNQVPSLENHIFIGWFYNDKPYIFKNMPNGTLVLKAKYLDETKEYNEVSNLPKVFINLDNNKPLDNVNRDDYVDSSFTISSDKIEDNVNSLRLEFKGRGHGSWTDSGPKRGYRLKFKDKQSLFGEAKSKHWVLLAGANFYDTSLSKNALAFNLARDVFSNIEYTSSTRWVELYINGEYRGVYLFAEHVRVDEGRVDIDAEYGIIDTGYLIEYDAYAKEAGPEGIYWFSIPGYKHPVELKRPDPDDYDEEGISEALFRSQVEFIKNYTNGVLQAALNQDYEEFIKLADIDSFVDMYILHELFKNTDTGWSSFFMYKKPGGKLYAGPAWDFDATAGKNRGDQSPRGFFVSDTVLQSSDYTASELYINLMKTEGFKNKVNQRWQELSNDVKSYVKEFLSDDFILENKFAFGRNLKRWSNAGPDYGYYKDQSAGEIGWIGSIRALRTWLIDRSNWFDQHLK